MSSEQRGHSFEDYAVVACGTLSPEINYLKKQGFLNARRILFTKPGRHEVPEELESQLRQRVAQARKYTDRIIIVYGGKFCYLNAKRPERTINMIIEELGQGLTKIKATHCVDMLASPAEREEISHGEKVFWLTPGWVVYRNFVFQDWDKGKANETFPQNSGGAVLLDAIGFFDEYSESHPEVILEFSDWMSIPIIPTEVSLTRFKQLLLECITNN
jgi:hypothetical protein